jgi:hypothetical protein
LLPVGLPCPREARAHDLMLLLKRCPQGQCSRVGHHQLGVRQGRGRRAGAWPQTLAAGCGRGFKAAPPPSSTALEEVCARLPHLQAHARAVDSKEDCLAEANPHPCLGMARSPVCS